MFGLGKKKEEAPISYVKSMPQDDEIELIPEAIPSELPALDLHQSITPEKPSFETKSMPLFPEVPIEQPVSQVIIPKREVIKKIEPVEKFIEMKAYQAIVEDVNGVVSDFDAMSIEIEKAIEIKEMRNEKMDSLQSTLEDVGKKLMQVDAILFGG